MENDPKTLIWCIISNMNILFYHSRDMCRSLYAL